MNRAIAKRTYGRRLLTIILAVVMVLGLMPAAAPITAYAAEPDTEITTLANGSYTIRAVDSVSTIQSGLNAVLANASAGNTVTVTGSKTNADSTLMLTIPDGVTVKWGATYGGDLGDNLLTYSKGNCIFELIEGGSLTNATGIAIYDGGWVSASTIISGGKVESGGTAIYISYSTATINGGTIKGTYALRNVGGTIAVGGNVTVEGEVWNSTITSTGTITIAAGTTLKTTRTLENNGTIVNNGTLQILNQGKVENNGIIENNGSLLVAAGGTLNLNYGSDITGSGGSISSPGIINDYRGEPVIVNGNTVTISQGNHVADIRNALQGVMDGLGGGSTVIVNGSKTDADVQLFLSIPAGVTIKWQATYSGDMQTSLIAINGGSGTFEVAEGGSIINTKDNGGTALNVSGESSNVTVKVSGGIVKASSAAIDAAQPDMTIEVSGGTVNQHQAAQFMRPERTQPLR